MRADPNTKIVLSVALAVGAALSILCVRTASSFGTFEAFLLLWGICPYLVLLLMPKFVRDWRETIGATVAVVVPDLVGRIGFLLPTSSTAALVLLWLPFWLLLVFIPLGIYTVRSVLWFRRRMHG